MTEAQWTAGADPVAMLHHARAAGASDRQLRLFACASARAFRTFGFGAAPNSTDLAAIEAAEELADDPSGAARASAREAMRRSGRWGMYWLSESTGDAAAQSWLGLVFRETLPQEFRAQQAALLRDIFGNPYRPPLRRACAPCGGQGRVLSAPPPDALPFAARRAWEACAACAGRGFTAVDPAPWLAWGDGTVTKLAAAIYAERAFERLPILADALEEASCDEADLLAHLRGPGPHVRGCWALDLLLGKMA